MTPLPRIVQGVNKSMLNFPDEYTGTPENVKQYKQLLADAGASSLGGSAQSKRWEKRDTRGGANQIDNDLQDQQ